MAAANRQGQGEARPPADAAPALPDRALYARLRKCELAAYSHVLRAFVGQGLVLDASRCAPRAAPLLRREASAGLLGCQTHMVPVWGPLAEQCRNHTSSNATAHFDFFCDLLPRPELQKRHKKTPTLQYHSGVDWQGLL